MFTYIEIDEQTHTFLSNLTFRLLTYQVPLRPPSLSTSLPVALQAALPLKRRPVLITTVRGALSSPRLYLQIWLLGEWSPAHPSQGNTQQQSYRRNFGKKATFILSNQYTLIEKEPFLKLQKQHTQIFLGYKFSMVIIFVEGSGEITKVSADLRKGNYIFIYRIRTLCRIFALWRKNLLIGSAKLSPRCSKVVS